MKYFVAALLIYLCIVCIICSFKYKPKYPYYFWFCVTLLGLIFMFK